MTSAIAIDKLGKTYPRTWNSASFTAVTDLSLNVSEGEVFGFIGPNGAGKSTTIKVLTGVLRPTSGFARIFGLDVSLPDARRGLGYVPENPSLYDFLTPLELLLMGLDIHGVKVPSRRKHCMDWLERFDLAYVANKHIRNFSKGMTQRAALAHALAIQPRLLILDEPLSGLDPVGRKDVVDILSEYRGLGGTIFLTSHVLHDVERLADRFGLIHGGKLLTVQSPQDLLHDAQTVTVRSSGATRIANLTEETSERWRAEVRRDHLWQVLDSMRQANHTILEIRPSLTLEDVFFHYLESAPIENNCEEKG